MPLRYLEFYIFDLVLREESYIGWSGFRAFAPRPVCPPAWVLTTKLVRNSRTPHTILGVGVTHLQFIIGMSASFVLLTRLLGITLTLPRGKFSSRRYSSRLLKNTTGHGVI